MKKWNKGWKKWLAAVFMMICLCAFGTVQAATVDQTSTTAGASKLLRQAMLERKASYTFAYKGKLSPLKTALNNNSLVQKAFLIDSSTTDDYDYLRNVVKSYQAFYQGVDGNMKVTFKFEYWESKAQTKKVNSEVKKMIKSLKLTGKSEYAKIKAVHDYIADYMEYDQSMKYYSAYHAVADKTAVCQGYIGFTYKMMKAAGIDCRIVTGTANGANHGWNMVKLGGKWYALDVTWDDPIVVNGSLIIYDFFLKSDANMTGHVKDNYSYPKATSNYR